MTVTKKSLTALVQNTVESLYDLICDTGKNYHNKTLIIKGGDPKIIEPFIQEIMENLNARNTKAAYNLTAYYAENEEYVITIEEKDFDLLEYGLEEDSESVIAEKAFDEDDRWENDGLALELNYGFCSDEGRHPKTSDEDWALFQKSIKEDYSEDLYKAIEARLKARKTN